MRREHRPRPWLIVTALWRISLTIWSVKPWKLDREPRAHHQRCAVAVCFLLGWHGPRGTSSSAAAKNGFSSDVFAVMKRTMRASRPVRCKNLQGRDGSHFMTGLAPPFPRALAGLLHVGDLLVAHALEFRLDIVLDPLRVPPLHGQDRDAMQVDAVVEVVAGGEAGPAGPPLRPDAASPFRLPSHRSSSGGCRA